jgi:hypothetical protein
MTIILLAGASAFCWVIWLVRNDIFLINLRSKLLCRYSTMEHIGSAPSLSWKKMNKTRRRSTWRVEN